VSKMSIPLLELLADGHFHSGETIGGLLGVSRTAVWKQLQKMSAIGLSIESVRGRGYRLPGGLELLSGSLIKQALTPAAVSDLYGIDVLLQTESTNAVAMAHAVAHGVGGYACFAEYQSAGRGRRGRSWVSPFGQNLYFSLTWQFDDGAASLEGLSLAVGVCVARVLKRLGLERVSLKWPNDILVEGCKLGGVLLEMTGDPSGRCQVVVGVGLNVFMSDGSAHGIEQPWTSLDAHLKPAGYSRNQLAAELLNELLPMLSCFSEAGFVDYQQEWSLLDGYRHCLVSLQSGNQQYVGVAQGVTANGALRLLVDGVEREFYGGEVSLRLADDS